MATHSVLPWQWDEPANWRRLSARVCTAKFEPIAQVQLSGWPRRIGLANAEFITRACNVHGALLAACVTAIGCLTGEDEEGWMQSQKHPESPYHFLWKAIAKAKGGAA